MVKCAKCGTGWTSSGLPICPICGTKVPAPVTASAPPPPPVPIPDPVPLIERPAPSFAKAPEPAPCKNGSAVMEMPRDLCKEKTTILPAPVRPPEARKPKTVVLPAPEPPPVFRLSEPTTADHPVEKDPPAPVFRLSDPSAADIPVQKELPTPARPLIFPLVLGSMAFVPALLLPLTLAFESTRVLGVLGFCMAGFFAPFAPIAWMVGLGAEQRRRHQGLRPERPVTLGRMLGQAATMVLVGELTLGLIAVAALRLSGQFPSSFWAIF